MINEVFDWCVEILEYTARLLNMSYEEVNIWLFCIIEPIIFLWMLGYIINLRRELKRTRKSNEANQNLT